MRKICSYCREKVPSPESCACEAIRYGPDTIPRIRFGDEEYDWESRKCPDCGVLQGVTITKTVAARSALCAVSGC